MSGIVLAENAGTQVAAGVVAAVTDVAGDAVADPPVEDAGNDGAPDGDAVGVGLLLLQPARSKATSTAGPRMDISRG